MNINWKQKLTSRKLWIAIAGIIGGLVVYFGADGNEIAEVAAIVLQIASGVSYILGESKVDAARVANELPEEK